MKNDRSSGKYIIIIIPCRVEGRKGQYTHNLRENNDKYVKSVSTKILTDHETASLAKDLKCIPTTEKPASHKNFLKDFEAFSRSMILKLFKDHDPFKVKYLMMKHILRQQKHSNTRISPHATLLMLRTALLKEKLYAYFQRTQLRNHLN